jgi:hypothetical protein
MQPNLRSIQYTKWCTRALRLTPDTSIRKSQYKPDMLLNRRLLIQIVPYDYDGIISLGASY